MKVFYFAELKQIIGKGHDNINLSKKMRVLDVIKLLKEKDKNYTKAFSNLKNIKCAVNCEYSNFTKVVVNNDEIAFFPPVTGG
ncbi:MAG: molybdopterin synthase sulfur carrier subunit [Rickettsiales bacterium]|nr:molybdopterin synthase sulfur carrier subunit [Rickettsiales bacterium]